MENRPTILIIDDDERIRNSLADILVTQRYKVIQAANGIEGLEKVKSDPPDVILLDINMPGMSGIEVLKQVKSERDGKLIPIVIVSGQNDVDLRIEALKLGVDDFLSKPPHAAELTARVRSLTKVKAYNDYMRHYQTILEEEVRKRTTDLNNAHEKLRNASLDTIHRLSRAAEYKDEDTSVHIQRMSQYVVAIAEKIGMGEAEKDTLLYSSPMHDIGKIGIPDRILLKPGKLDSAEWEIMKRHAEIGSQILDNSTSDFIKMGKVIAITHHEKWDGSGYPNGLAGVKIPIEGRIVALADVFDALTTRRPYKEPFPNEKAFAIIMEESGTHFDPEIVQAFFDIQEEILEIQRSHTDRGTPVLISPSEDGGISRP